MLDVKKLQAIRDSLLGVTVNPNNYGDLNSVVYLQQILDAVKGTDPLNVRGNLAEHIYLQKIRNAKLGVADGQFGNLPNSVYLQQIVNAFNVVADGQFGSLPESSYLDAWLAVAGVTPVSYLLRDEFTTAQAAPLGSPRTCEPGPGALTIVDTGNRLSIAAGKLTSTTAAAGGDPGAWGPLQVRAPGICFFAQLTRTGGSGGKDVFVGWDATLGGSINGGYAFLLTLAARLYVVDGIPNIQLYNAVNSDGVNYTFAICLRATGAYYFIKGGSLFPDWRLIFVSSALSSNLYANVNNSLSSFTSDFMRVAQLGSPFVGIYDLATARSASPVSGAALTGMADSFVEFTWTPQAAEVLELDFRRTDADNRWIVRGDQAAGKIYLIQRQGGGETERGAAGGLAQVWNVGTAYRVMVLCTGQNITVIVANVVKQNYTSAAFNLTATGFMVSGFTNANGNFVCWPHAMTGSALTELNRVCP